RRRRRRGLRRPTGMSARREEPGMSARRERHSPHTSPPPTRTVTAVTAPHQTGRLKLLRIVTVSAPSSRARPFRLFRNTTTHRLEIVRHGSGANSVILVTLGDGA